MKGSVKMIRGTTAQFKFKLPYSLSELDSVTIKFWQSGNPDDSLPIYKYKQNCVERVAREIYVSLRPSETALFSDKYKAKLQLRAQPNVGGPFGSMEQLITVYPMPDDIIIDDPTIDPDVPQDPDTPIIPDTPTENGWIILDGQAIVN